MISFPNLDAWDKNATIWDSAMADGSLFQKNIIEPDTLAFLDPKKEMRVLDVACGNGQMSRILANLGCKVTALDSSREMIRLAEARSKGLNIAYHINDVADSKSWNAVRRTSFEAALCNMALMDIPDIVPVFKGVYSSLKERGVFVFSITHPSFDKAVGPHIMEIHEKDGELIYLHAIKVLHYKSSSAMPAKALPHLPALHYHYHRSLESYLTLAFETGFTMTGIAEPAFPKDSNLAEHKGWHKLHDIPVALIIKLLKSK